MDKPFAEACERNRAPILEVLRGAFAECASVLEIGSGTGQHAVYFAAALPHLVWQTSELPANHAGIRAWLEEAQLPNLRMPLALDVAGDWPGTNQGEVFPKPLGVARLVVAEKIGKRRDKGAGTTIRPQTHVDLVKPSGAG